MNAEPLGGGGLELAFLGCGAATRMHSRTLRRLDPSVARHFASRSAERARMAAEEGGGRAFGSYDEALRDPGVDAVLVATPPDTHLELVTAALEAGKHVIVEKPAFPRPEDFDLVDARRREARRQVLVAENYYYKPLRRRLARLLEEGAVGEPLFVAVNAVKLQGAEGWRRDPERAGGGALFEGGIHWIDFMAELGLEVRGVRGVRAGGDAGPERGMAVAFEYAGGAAGTLLYSWEVPSPLRGLRVSRIYGREGAIAFESNGVCLLAWGRRKRLLFPGFRDISGYRAMFRDFLEALRSGAPPEMTLGKAKRDVELVRAAYRSAGLEADPP